MSSPDEKISELPVCLKNWGLPLYPLDKKEVCAIIRIEEKITVDYTEAAEIKQGSQ